MWELYLWCEENSLSLKTKLSLISGDFILPSLRLLSTVPLLRLKTVLIFLIPALGMATIRSTKELFPWKKIAKMVCQ